MRRMETEILTCIRSLVGQCRPIVPNVSRHFVSVVVLLLVSSSCLFQPVNGIGGMEGVKVHHLTTSAPLVDVNQENLRDFNIFCRKGDTKRLINYFKSVKLRIVSSADDIKIVKGCNYNEVYTRYMETTRWFLWAQNLLPWRIRETNLPTFNSSCIGVDTRKEYTALLVVRTVDIWNVLTLLAGLVIFFMAPKMARSQLLFYTSGTVLGGIGFALLLMFIVFRFLPRGKTRWGVFTFLWVSSLYAAGETWNRFGEIVQDKLPYLAVYLTTGSVLAFLICYRFGPIANPRSLDIVTWVLQGLSLLLIHLSSDLVEVSTVIILIVLCYHSFAGRLYYNMGSWWRRRFPAKPKLLTEEEYIAQGARETEVSLQQLRNFCNSPQCNSWKIVSRLQDPKRFSGFITGDSHLSDAEMMDYESDIEQHEAQLSNGHLPLTEDSSDDSD